VLAFTFAASFAACYSWTGYWPLDYVVYSPAERVLVRNPLIGM
jgi:membrane dipeptidase